MGAGLPSSKNKQAQSRQRWSWWLAWNLGRGLGLGVRKPWVTVLTRLLRDLGQVNAPL